MIKINNVKWEIYLVSPNHPEMRQPDGTWTIGACNWQTKGIYIVDNLNEALTWKVLAHEITHAAMFSYNVTMSAELEEFIADLIATYGFEIIIQANKIFSRIT